MKLARKVVCLEASNDISLDYNYQYELMKEIYNSIEVIDMSLANHLHNIGFHIDNKKYKLFTHHLYIHKPEYTKDFIKIKKGTSISLIVSGLKQIVNNVSLGFLEKGTLKLFGNSFKVISIENDKKVRFNKITLYKAINPIVATKQNENKNIIYVSPFESDYYKILAHNLKRKYKLVYGKDYEGELYFDIEDTLSIKKKAISKIKSKFMIIGYSNFQLFIEADADMQKIAYYCGLGGYNSLGMGAVNYITSWRC